MEHEHVRCRCAHHLHFVDFWRDPDDGDFGALVVSTRDGPWWRRLGHAVAYVFGRRDLVEADVLFDDESVRAAIDFLDNSIEAPEK